jgi:hypothetical protein
MIVQITSKQVLISSPQCKYPLLKYRLTIASCLKIEHILKTVVLHVGRKTRHKAILQILVGAWKCQINCV